MFRLGLGLGLGLGWYMRYSCLSHCRRGVSRSWEYWLYEELWGDQSRASRFTLVPKDSLSSAELMVILLIWLLRLRSRAWGTRSCRWCWHRLTTLWSVEFLNFFETLVKGLHIGYQLRNLRWQLWHDLVIRGSSIRGDIVGVLVCRLGGAESFCR